MERLVRDLLRLARLDAGQETLEQVPCPVATLFHGVEADLADAIEGGNRSSSTGSRAMPGPSPGESRQAPRRLAQPAGERLQLRPAGSRIVMGATRRNGRIHITVADEGPGVPEADLPRIFERFYRADKARSRGERDPGGTGLGLAIVKHLIELHGGRVSAANRQPTGAVVTVELPG
jgi:signal transduction histidine kinase